MGLIDFVKDAGAKLFNWTDDDAELAKQVETHITKMGLTVEDLCVSCDDEVVTLAGVTPTQVEREKIVLLVGNSQGVDKVQDNLAVKEPVKEDAVFRTVVSGDTLSKIAKEHYGNANKYPTIFEANRPMLKNADDIFPGQVLRLPSLN